MVIFAMILKIQIHMEFHHMKVVKAGFGYIIMHVVEIIVVSHVVWQMLQRKVAPFMAIRSNIG
jgi:hypothetical protein